MLAGCTSPAYHFFFTDTATTEIYTLSLHDALPISTALDGSVPMIARQVFDTLVQYTDSSDVEPALAVQWRSEEHTSELQSHHDLVCRLLLEKKKNTNYKIGYRDVGQGQPHKLQRSR